jgi:hypothetical protein
MSIGFVLWALPVEKSGKQKFVRSSLFNIGTKTFHRSSLSNLGTRTTMKVLIEKKNKNEVHRMRVLIEKKNKNEVHRMRFDSIS